MAVNTPGNDPSKGNTAMSDALQRAQLTGTAGAGAAPSASQDQQHQQQNTGNAGNRGGHNRGGRAVNPLMNFNNVAARPVSRFAAGAVVRAFETALKKAFEDSVDPAAAENFAFHILDNQNQGLALSSILFCYLLSHEGANYVAVYNMAVEGSAPRLNNRLINIGDRSVEQISVPGDVFDSLMWDKVTTYLTERYGSDTVIINAGTDVLPNTLVPEVENLRKVVYYASQALFNAIDNKVTHSETPLSLTAIDNSITLAADVNYNVPPVENAVGQPIRSDIAITLRATQPQGNAVSTQNDYVRELTRVDSYVDLIYSAPAPLMPGQMPTTQHYYARNVITQIDSLTDAITLEHMLLGLATNTVLGSNYAWAGVYLGRYGVAGRDLRDIGAIGYEVNLSGDPNSAPDRIDTKADTFTRTNLVQLLAMAFHPQLVYSMDVEEVGGLATLHQTFIASANGDKESYDQIIRAADRLTGGKFSPLWQGGAIAQDDINRIHLGSYTAPSGEIRDIRDLDYLALLNLVGAHDMQTVVDWSQTFDETSVPLPLRMEKRAKILQAVLSNCTITGFARRITFLGNFIETLLKACAAAGLLVRQQNVAFLEGTSNRGQFNAQAFAVGGPGANMGVFTVAGSNAYGQQTNQAFFGNHANFYGQQRY